MKNPYQKLMTDIPVPAGLEERVLSAARQAGETARRPRRRTPPLLRAAVCGACALALVLGSLTLRPAEEQDPAAGGMPAASFRFGLTAYAAETGMTHVPNANNGIAFTVGYGLVDPEAGDFTGCVFQIEGENIQTVSLSLDRGSLYRYQLHENLTEAQADEFRQAMAEGRIAAADIGQGDDGTWYVPEMAVLGQSVQERYDPALSYGFRVPPADMAYGTGMGIVPEAEMDIDYFNGAILTVGAVFTDGTEQTRTYRLSSGCLRVGQEADGTLTILPQLAGDREAYIYGLYAESLDDSRWFQWPVAGANQVSMSYPFGVWEHTFINENEDGEEEIIEKTVVHNGIDIPALQGAVITAAEGGAVAESGFDPERGNYVVLDHGGGLRTVYAACEKVTVQEGDTVAAGAPIALVGATGMSTGPHLCFQVWQDGHAQNPVAYFDSAVRSTLCVG